MAARSSARSAVRAEARCSTGPVTRRWGSGRDSQTPWRARVSWRLGSRRLLPPTLSPAEGRARWSHITWRRGQLRRRLCRGLGATGLDGHQQPDGVRRVRRTGGRVGSQLTGVRCRHRCRRIILEATLALVLFTDAQPHRPPQDSPRRRVAGAPVGCRLPADDRRRYPSGDGLLPALIDDQVSGGGAGGPRPRAAS